MRNTSGIPLGAWAGTRITRNGAGFVTQPPDFASNGTAVIGCDSHGWYYKRPTDAEWQSGLNFSQMPAGDVDPLLGINGTFTDTSGCFAVAIAYSNADRVYFTYNGFLYSYSISGKAAVRCGLAQQAFNPGANAQRTQAVKLRVDNQNPSAFLFGTFQGVYYSTNDGTTVTSLAAPACDTDPGNATLGTTPYPHFVEIDPTSTVTSSLRQRCYYSVRAAGVTGGIYESTTGPSGTYALISGSPKDMIFMRFGASGKLWVVTSAGDIWWYTHAAGVFTKLAANPTGGAFSVAEDPANAAHLIVGTDNMAQSFDTGATWQNWPSAATALSMATTQAYLQVPGTTNYWGGATACLTFNPSGSNELWRNWGFGISKTTVPATLAGAPLRWFEMNKGIDQANCTSLVCPPGGSLFAGFFDVGAWVLSDLQNCTNRPKAPQKPTDDWTLTPPFIVQPTNAIGYAADNPSYLVQLSCNGFSGTQPFVIGTIANPTMTAGNVLSITINGVTTNVTLSGTTLTSTINDIRAANIYGLRTDNDGANHLQLISSANYPLTIANVTGTPLASLGITAGTFNGSGPKGNPHYGSSTDGGKTWTMFPTHPPDETSTGGCDFGGCMAVGLQGHIAILWQASRSPWATEDGGTTWAELPLPGLTADGVENGVGDWSNGFFSKKNICYDAAGGNWYLYNYGPPTATTQNGIWKATRPLGTWTQVFTGSFPNGIYNSRLRAVPGHAGHLFFTAGPGAPGTPAMQRSTDGGVTWTSVANTATIHDVAFSDFGGAYPAVLVFGMVNSIGGYHISYNNCVNWTPLGYLGDWVDYPKILQGNPDKLEFYVGLAGSGVLRLAIAHTETIQ